jgi:hypothetical protein
MEDLPMFRGNTKLPFHLPATVLLLGLAATPLVAQDMVGDCGDLPDKLAACEEFSCTFTHPFTGGSETRSVKGIQDELCQYHESMPNKGSMDCAYDETRRVTMADYYRAWFETGNPPPGGNPLNDAMGDGTCKISGY